MLEMRPRAATPPGGRERSGPRATCAIWAAALVCVLSACTSVSLEPAVAVRPSPPAVPALPPAPLTLPAPEPSPTAAQQPPPASPIAGRGVPGVSLAATPRAYRASGAAHLYGLHAERIYQGRLPPLLYAVAVLSVELDGSGQVRRLDWLRAPRHAPEVMTEIERMVRSGAPFPAPARLGRVVYTDTWLWHQSGKFQLDTLTQGQD